MPSKNYNLELQKSKLSIIKKYLDNPTRLYTGLEVKKFWRENIFKSLGDTQNEAVKAGRWSAYAHYLLVASCVNLFNKHGITKGFSVLVHPLVYPEIVDELLNRDVQITTLDINKETLHFHLDIFENYISELNSNDSKPNLIVIPSFTGLCVEISKIVEIAKKHNIPVMLIFLEGKLNFSMLETISQLKWGSVVLFKDSEPFLIEIREALNKLSLTDFEKKNIPNFAYLDQYLSTNKNYYLSLFIENRATSILEYHLETSKNNFEPILKSYNFFLSKDIFNNISFLENLLTTVLNFTDGKFNLKKILSSKTFKNNVEAVNNFIQHLQQYLNGAIPDLVFEIENQINRKPAQSFNLSDQVWDIQSKTKKIHSFFSNQVTARPAGTLEIPTFYFNRVYLRYFCYSTELDYWKPLFDKKGLQMSHTLPLHALFLEKNNLENANFISRFIMLI